ncbi:hypothetical protein SADUNF_Sadunf01G0053100 [Salix dunnii]|uniref:Uncharacterized protein n=1 Tax=Salix dunnii TaxID=1413687 RepID=A0A835NA03_9ROSI|nr:hypothetical protein SADUNF_Sadunf01G0053100 [Salix dunnii]
MESCCIWGSHRHLIQSHRHFIGFSDHHHTQRVHFLAANGPRKCNNRTSRICCTHEDPVKKPPQASPSSSSSSSSTIQLYNQIERLLTETARQSQDSWGGSKDWSEVEVLGILVIATPYASGFDYFFIADEVQFKFDRCFRSLQETVQDIPTFGIGHSLGSVIHLLIGSRYAVQRSGNIFMAFNNKEASSAIPLFSPVLVPMAQSLGPFLSQIASSPTVRRGAEMTMKQLESLSPPIMKQVLPLVEQLPPLYMDLVTGREDFSPRPEETRRLIKSYYGVSRNLLIKFKDDVIDETPTLAHVLSSEAAISSMLDMSIRLLPGDHGLPLQQAFPDVPPAMADAVNQGSELFANLTAGTPWEKVAKEVGSSLGADSRILRAQESKDLDHLVDVIISWTASNSGPRLLRS